MMITKCGHSFCEDCLDKMESCPVCRTVFALTDCQPNYALVKNNARFNDDPSKQPTRRTGLTLDQRLKELVKKRQNLLQSRVDGLIEKLLDQLQEKIEKKPDQSCYQCQLENLNPLVLRQINLQLEKAGLRAAVSKDTPNSSRAEGKYQVDVFFLNSLMGLSTGDTDSSTGTGGANVPLSSPHLDAILNYFVGAGSGAYNTTYMLPMGNVGSA
jgi:hypothetical protein